MMVVIPKRSLLALLTHIFFLAATQNITIGGISTAPSPTLTVPNPSLPTLVDGDSGYKLLGCYNELASYDTERALGVTGSYISPIFASRDALTVPLCLEGCAAAQSPAKSGQYIYAAVENTRECYCGLALSSASTSVDPTFCSSPCPADTTTSCGAPGFMTLYKLSPTVDNATSSIAPTSSPTPTATPTASQASIPKIANKVAMIGMWIGIGVGLAALTGLVIILLCWEQRRYNARQRLRAMELSMATGTGEFLGGFKFEQEQMQQGKISSTIASRRSGIIGEMNLLKVPPHEIQTEEAGRRHREAFAAWKRKTAAAKATAESSRNVLPEEPPQLPLEQHAARTEASEESTKKPKKEWRRTFEAWKSGEVPPLDDFSADK